MADREKIKLIGKGDIFKAVNEMLQKEPWTSLVQTAPLLSATYLMMASEIESMLFAEDDDDKDIFEKEN